ncbi:unnamed protein product [Mycena citricolor]|uniref:Uncharacterized protein n=1 Tax=Mycena citricolor TaxID=2018698 RepID=A0AAD2H1R0_9AGAR|nr:unnamed protein product [Mycena citricolor]
MRVGKDAGTLRQQDSSRHLSAKISLVSTVSSASLFVDSFQPSIGIDRHHERTLEQSMRRRLRKTGVLCAAG